MRVLMDASTANMGGARTHLRHLLQSLPHEASPDDSFVILVPHGASAPLQLLLREHTTTSFRLQEQIQLLEIPRFRGGLLQQFEARTRVIPEIALSVKADVLFSSTGYGVWNRPCPELLHLPNAGYFCPLYEQRALALRAKNTKLYFRRVLSLLSIRHTDFVMFLSESLKCDVERHLSLRHKRSAVVHYGVDTSVFSQASETPPTLAPQIKAWKEQGYQILLHVSSYALQKNMEVVLEALPVLQTMGHKVKWVTTLSREKTGEKELYDRFLKRTEELGLSEVIVSSGYLEHRELAWLYNNADAFVFPSHTESFGQPLVEAMAASLPVVASDRPVHHELGSDAFCYFDTFDALSCAQALHRVLSDPMLVERMKQRSTQRSRLFSWRMYTRRLLELLHEVASKPTSWHQAA